MASRPTGQPRHVWKAEPWTLGPEPRWGSSRATAPLPGLNPRERVQPFAEGRNAFGVWDTNAEFNRYVPIPSAHTGFPFAGTDTLEATALLPGMNVRERVQPFAEGRNAFGVWDAHA